MKKNYNFLVTFLLLIIIIFIIVFGAYDFIKTKESKLYYDKYSNISSNIQNRINLLIKEKQNATLSLTLALTYKNEKINNIVLKDSKFDLNELSKQFKEYGEFNNVWFQIINKEGDSVYRSWTDYTNDNIKSIRKDLKTVFSKPELKNTISVGIYDLTMKSMVPLENNGEFIGIFETITHFNSLVKILKEIDEVDSVVLVDKKFYNQLKEKSFTKKFVNNYYIANQNAHEELLKYIEIQDIDFMNIEKDFFVKDGYLIINNYIKNDKEKLANFIVFKKLDSINISDINDFRNNVILYLVMLIALVCLLFSVIYYYFYSNHLKKVYDKLDRNKEKLRRMNIDLQQTIDNEIQRNGEKNKILFQQNKMAAMGEMLENIAHQWRQPLSLITTEASSIKVKKEYGILTDAEELRSIESIIDTSKYLSSTVDDFRHYFLPDKVKNRFYSKDIIERCLKLFNHDIKNNSINVVKIVERFEIHTYENELIQVIINIINNAKDELLKKDIDSRFIFIDFTKIDNTAKLIIKDSGGGIDEEIIDRIFEPYFTTKHKSVGTGIGLYMCEEIIKRHINGNIVVKNSRYEYRDKLYTGAKFEINIPID